MSEWRRSCRHYYRGSKSLFELAALPRLMCRARNAMLGGGEGDGVDVG